MPRKGEPIVCGRRICSWCKHWLHITEFAYRRVREDIWVLPYCWNCKRAAQRQHYRRNRAAYIERVRRWKQNNPERVAGYVAKDAASGQRREREKRYYQIPENRLRRRERNRLFQTQRRRAAGKPEQVLKSSIHREYLAAIRAQAEYLRKLEPEPKIDHAPFVAWIRSRLPFYENSLEQLADICEVNPRRLRTLIDGVYRKQGKEYKVKGVGLDFVDRCLLNEGYSDLRDVYPDLYEDKSDVASADKSLLNVA